MEALAQLLRELHKEEAKDGDHVWIAFADGEVCLTKGGDLLGQRTLHQMEKPIVQDEKGSGVELPRASRVGDLVWPKVYANHKCMYTDSKRDAYALRRALIAEWEAWLAAVKSRHDIMAEGA